MAADEDEVAANGNPTANVPPDAASGQRIKRPVSPGVKTLMADFGERTRGLDGPAFDQAFAELIDQLVERNLAAAPAAVRDDMRETIRSYLEGDPTLIAMVAELRAAARR